MEVRLYYFSVTVKLNCVAVSYSYFIGCSRSVTYRLVCVEVNSRPTEEKITFDRKSVIYSR